MCFISISISYDNNFVILDFVNIKILFNVGIYCINYGVYFFIFKNIN